jgi:hypothetical protein
VNGIRPDGRKSLQSVVGVKKRIAEKESFFFFRAFVVVKKANRPISEGLLAKEKKHSD